jgi:phenylacetate-CoA ligase
MPLPSIKSVHAAAHLPAIPSPQAALLLSLLHQLDQTQWWPEDRLRAEQLAQMELLVDHARRTVPWYRDRLPASDSGAGRLSDETWSRVPILSRQDVQRHADALRSTHPPAGHQQVRPVATSGATGTPITVQTTEGSRLMWMALLLREHAWHARDLTATHVAVRIFGDKVAPWPEGLRCPDWGPPENVVYRTGPAAMLDIFTDTRRQLEWLVKQDPQILLTFPSNALELAALCRAEGVAFPNLRELRLVSEAVDADSRRFLGATWNVPVTDVYSAQEVGYIALQCPEQRYHVQAESVHVDVVDAEGRTCGPGEVGRVLVTTLHNFAMPLIRYEIGDYAEVGDACPCGRGLPVLNRILGRVRNMVALPDGERRWPNLAGPFYRDVAPVVQHQIVQHGLDSIEARLVVERPLSREEERALQALIVRRLGHPFSLRFSYPQRIERSRSGKFEEFVSLVLAPDVPSAQSSL